MNLPPERMAAAAAVARELEKLKADGIVPIVSQQSMATLLALVQDKRVSVAAALVTIEAWADDFCRRNSAELSRRAGEAKVVTEMDGPRVDPGTTLST